MTKYIILFLLSVILSLGLFTYATIANYKKEIQDRNEIITKLTRKVTDLENEIKLQNDTIERYKYNISICKKDNTNLRYMLKDYELRIKDLNEKYVNAKNTLEENIKKFENEMKKLKEEKPINFTDNVSQNIIQVNDAIESIIKQEQMEK